MKKQKAKLFNPKLFPMDLYRVLCLPMPLFLNIKKLYISEEAKKSIRGGALIAANHTDFSDPLLVGNCFWYRRMFFLAAKEVTDKKVLGPLLHLAGCITLDRDICDMSAIKKSISLLKKGHTLTVFPQGAITQEGDLSAIKGGVILMAMQAKVPVIPIYIHKKTKRGERNTVVIGEPLHLFDSENQPLLGIGAIEAAAETVLEKMIECKQYFEKTEGGQKNVNS